jgi:hypothetical protein
MVESPKKNYISIYAIYTKSGSFEVFFSKPQSRNLRGYIGIIQPKFKYIKNLHLTKYFGNINMILL